mmetsp:Transcript_4426/g.5130  ORF Transcript_4426/g.5130 Transcript_4426/m.5130 type:complete len:378 (+) Transcript_4426:86-1219(+)
MVLPENTLLILSTVVVIIIIQLSPSCFSLLKSCSKDMARANLIVSEELAKLFLEAVKPEGNIKWLKAVIDDDVNINLSESGSPKDEDGNGNDNDINTVKNLMNGLNPCFVIFCLDTSVPTKQWVLISYVPDGCKVRSRMLYASAGEDIKQRLGHSNFKADVHVTDTAELTPAQIYNHVRREAKDLPLNEKEILLKEEKKAAFQLKANAMNVVPFKTDEKFMDALSKFGSQELNLLEILVTGKECIEAGSLVSSSSSDLSSSTIEKAEPRFYLVRRPTLSANVTYFVYTCPENSKVRSRMLFSTSKAAVTNYLAENGIEVSKFVEVSDPAEIDSMFLGLESSVKTSSSNDVELKQPVISKPSRPGRGKARIIKKKQAA